MIELLSMINIGFREKTRSSYSGQRTSEDVLNLIFYLWIIEKHLKRKGLQRNKIDGMRSGFGRREKRPNVVSFFLSEKRSSAFANVMVVLRGTHVTHTCRHNLESMGYSRRPKSRPRQQSSLRLVSFHFVADFSTFCRYREKKKTEITLKKYSNREISFHCQYQRRYDF